MTSRVIEMESPIGRLRLTSDGRALTSLEMLDSDDDRDPTAGADRADEVLATARRQLERYFAGELRDFDLPLAPRGTAFQTRVWEALRAIPYGATISYRELATRIGQPTATRAVGLANGRNPIAVIVPCHRVIGADGSLTGYGGGLARKKILLDLEAGASGGRIEPRREQRASFALPFV